MPSALVIGGNRFVGKKLSRLLVERGFAVTILNRGSLDDGLGDKVDRIRADRAKRPELQKAFESRQWNFIFDQVCYTSEEAELACSLAKSRVGRYVLISTQSIYEYGFARSESDFEPQNYQFDESTPADYGEGKRRVESVLARHPDLKPLLIRMPMIVGEDDYTGRLLWHIERCLRGLPMYFPNLEARLGYIHSTQAAKAIADLALSNLTGPINCAAPGSYSMRELTELISAEVSRQPVFVSEDQPDATSPFGITENWTMDLQKFQSAIPKLSSVQEWMPTLIKELHSNAPKARF